MTQLPRINRANDSIESSGRFTIYRYWNPFAVVLFAVDLWNEYVRGPDKGRNTNNVGHCEEKWISDLYVIIVYARDHVRSNMYRGIPNVVASTWAIHPFGDGLSYSFTNNIRQPSPPRDACHDVQIRVLWLTTAAAADGYIVFLVICIFYNGGVYIYLRLEISLNMTRLHGSSPDQQYDYCPEYYCSATELYCMSTPSGPTTFNTTVFYSRPEFNRLIERSRRGGQWKIVFIFFLFFQTGSPSMIFTI